MKKYATITVLLISSLSFAGQKMNISARTGARISDQEECPVLQPIRKAQVQMQFSKLISTVDPSNHSVSMSNEIVCNQSREVSVFQVPENATCYSWENSDEYFTCATESPTGEKVNLTSVAVIVASKNTKVYFPQLSTNVGQNFDFRYNNTVVFDPNLQKIQMSLSSDHFKTQDAYKEVAFGTVVTVEDNQ